MSRLVSSFAYRHIQVLWWGFASLVVVFSSIQTSEYGKPFWLMSGSLIVSVVYILLTRFGNIVDTTNDPFDLLGCGNAAIVLVPTAVVIVAAIGSVEECKNASLPWIFSGIVMATLASLFFWRICVQISKQ